MRDNWKKQLAAAKDSDPISPLWLTHCIDEVKDDDTIVIKESALVASQIDFSQAGTVRYTGEMDRLERRKNLERFRGGEVSV